MSIDEFLDELQRIKPMYKWEIHPDGIMRPVGIQTTNTGLLSFVVQHTDKTVMDIASHDRAVILFAMYYHIMDRMTDLAEDVKKVRARILKILELQEVDAFKD